MRNTFKFRLTTTVDNSSTKPMTSGWCTGEIGGNRSKTFINELRTEDEVECSHTNAKKSAREDILVEEDELSPSITMDKHKEPSLTSLRHSISGSDVNLAYLDQLNKYLRRSQSDQKLEQ